MDMLQTFPMTVQALHLAGANLVRCPALGTSQVFITDDFGDFVETPCIPTMVYGLTSNGEH